jgi:hypothetical protein
LKLAVLAEVGAWADRIARKASLVLVLPTEPVTLAMRADAAPAAGATEIDQCLQGVADADQVARRIGTSRETTGRRRAARQGVGNEDVAVGGLARQREEEVALADGATVERDAGGLERPDIALGASARSTSAEVQSVLIGRAPAPPRRRRRGASRP